VVSAPTGAGKTAVFEMAMARFFSVDLQHNNTAGNSSGRGGHRIQVSKQRKMVYVSPSKALCEERFEDWSTRLAAMQLGIEVAVITGDGDPSEAFRDLASAHLILTTPEKWDSLTRRWTENFFLFGCVKLFMIDEVHLLADSSRGCCLESVVCRMKGIQRAARKVQSTPADIETSRYEDQLHATVILELSSSFCCCPTNMY
jgi:ATP-dependent DNA helicase HFM1/MER3